MGDYLAIIRRIIEWHRTIREHVKLVGDSISDREALISLERARADWVPGQPELQVETQTKLYQSITAMGDGLKNHFDYEEKVLPPLLGEFFMMALVLDHRKIMREIDEDKVIVGETKLEGLSREDLLSAESRIQQAISSLCQLSEEHLTREEVILEMLQRALEEKAQSQS